MPLRLFAENQMFDPTVAQRELQESCAVSPLVYGAIGDAYGFCFEFAPALFVTFRNDLHYHQNPDLRCRKGSYSDDTQMQLALAELMLGDETWSPERIAQRFLDTYRRDPRSGYAHRFSKFLKEVESGADFIARISPESERNGAAMRAAVVGLYPTIAQTKEYATLQARVTHDTTVGVDSAVATALLAHYYCYELGPPDEVTKFLNKHVPDHDWDSDWQGPVPIQGISTVQAALTALRESHGLADLLKRCVHYTGDVDSVATIALACGSCDRSRRRDLPRRLWRGLEQRQYGLNYLLRIDNQLRDRFALQ